MVKTIQKISVLFLTHGLNRGLKTLSFKQNHFNGFSNQ